MDEPVSSIVPAPVGAPPEAPRVPAFLSGDSGVGWGFLLYLALFASVSFVTSLCMRFLLAGKLPSLWRFVTGELVFCISAFVPGLVMAHLENRPFGNYGLPRQGAFGRLFWIGMLWGIVALSVLMVTMRAFGVFYFGGLALSGMRLAGFAIFWVAFFVLVGLVEEFFLRGYTQYTLSRGLGFWPAALMLSAAFGAMHLSNQGEDKVGALGAAIIGLFFCLTLKRTGNLWFAVGLHASWDWGETFLFSVPNSGMVAPGHMLNSHFQGPGWLTGGSVGPEASIFVFIVMGLMWLLFHFLYPAKKHVEAGLVPGGGASPASTQATYQE
jgi:CAAX protease family protein